MNTSLDFKFNDSQQRIINSIKKIRWIGGGWISNVSRDRGYGDVLIISMHGFGVLAFQCLPKMYRWISVSKCIGFDHQKNFISEDEKYFKKITKKNFGNVISESTIIKGINEIVKKENGKLENFRKKDHA